MNVGNTDCAAQEFFLVRFLYLCISMGEGLEMENTVCVHFTFQVDPESRERTFTLFVSLFESGAIPSVSTCLQAFDPWEV